MPGMMQAYMGAPMPPPNRVGRLGSTTSGPIGIPLKPPNNIKDLQPVRLTAPSAVGGGGGVGGAAPASATNASTWAPHPNGAAAAADGGAGGQVQAAARAFAASEEAARMVNQSRAVGGVAIAPSAAAAFAGKPAMAGGGAAINSPPAAGAAKPPAKVKMTELLTVIIAQLSQSGQQARSDFVAETAAKYKTGAVTYQQAMNVLSEAVGREQLVAEVTRLTRNAQMGMA